MRTLWLGVLLALSSHLYAQTTIETENVKRMVVFLYADPGHPLGTGFLVFVPRKGESSPSTLPGKPIARDGLLLLITARHIVDPAWALCPQPQPELIYMRLNRKNYSATSDEKGVDYVPLHLTDKRTKKYFVSEDSKVDAAVINVLDAIGPGFSLSQERDDFTPMSISVFANPAEIKTLKIGDSVVSAGLLPKKPGEKRNYPFFKFGEISNIPDEPTWIGCEPGKPELTLERVWFIAANLVSGNSGAPIFYVPNAMCLIGGLFRCTNEMTRPMIIGVQSSTFDGADISGMTPIEDVFSIIEKIAPPEADLYRGDPAKHS